MIVKFSEIKEDNLLSKKSFLYNCNELYLANDCILFLEEMLFTKSKSKIKKEFRLDNQDIDLMEFFYEEYQKIFQIIEMTKTISHRELEKSNLKYKYLINNLNYKSDIKKTNYEDELLDSRKNIYENLKNELNLKTYLNNLYFVIEKSLNYFYNLINFIDEKIIDKIKDKDLKLFYKINLKHLSKNFLKHYVSLKRKLIGNKFKTSQIFEYETNILRETFVRLKYKSLNVV